MKRWFDKDKNWFNRHLYWTWILGNFVVMLVAFLPWFFSAGSPNLPFWVVIWLVLWAVIGIIALMIYVETVYLKQKKRSLWFLLLTIMLFLGMGIIMSLGEKTD
jgi:threonine/homoserine/homoserine lactone efflux protein